MRTCIDCGRPHRARGYCGSCYNRHFAKPSQALTPCTVCGTMVMKQKRDHTKRQPVCSDMCKAFLRLGRWPISMVSESPRAKRRARAMAKLEWSMVQPPTWQRWYAGRCKRCGAWFVYHQPQMNWCSEICQRRGHRARRRSRLRSAFVEDVRSLDVFERDGWRCQIPQCIFRSRVVARTKVVPDDRAPVLDHIVPLAQGGKHEMSNVQCAHFKCNSIKRDNAANDQLLLFG